MLLVQCGNDCIGESLPSLALMRSGAPVLNGQSAVQQQDALPRPAFQIAMPGMRYAQITGQFLIDVLQGWWRGHARSHRKAEPMRLPRPVIGVLTQNDHLYLFKRRQIKCPKYLSTRGVYALSCRLFGPQKLTERGHVVGGKLGGQPCLPAVLDTDIGRGVCGMMRV